MTTSALFCPVIVLTLLAVPLLRFSAPTIIAITGGTVLDVRTGKEIPEATVVIEGDRIAHVGTSLESHKHNAARILDATGRWIIPGLIDMHVHVSTVPDVPLELYVANGVTAVRDLGGSLTRLRLMRQEIETGRRWLAPGFGLHYELALLVDAGLSPLDAIRAATYNAAQALGRENQLGTLEAGKFADMVVLTANPLTDIRNTTTIDAVIVGGRVLERADLSELLAVLEESARKDQPSPR